MLGAAHGSDEKRLSDYFEHRRDAIAAAWSAGFADRTAGAVLSEYARDAIDALVAALRGAPAAWLAAAADHGARYARLGLGADELVRELEVLAARLADERRAAPVAAADGPDDDARLAAFFVRAGASAALGYLGPRGDDGAYAAARPHGPARAKTDDAENVAPPNDGAEAAPRRADERLRFALRAGRTGTWELDLATAVLSASTVFKENHGFGPDDEFTYNDLAASVVDDDRAAWRQKVEVAAAECSDLDVEYRTRWPDGSVHWVRARAGCVAGDRGRAAWMLGTSVNTDEGKRIEEELRAADRRKDEFLSTASHELRTPLNAILGWASMLRSGELEPELRQRAAETIERNAKAQVRLIEDVLDGSRIITGNLRLEIRPVDPNAVVAAAVDAVRHAAEAKQITLSVAADPAAKTIAGDRDRLRQVVWNLVSNAIKFTPAGGHVEVRVGHIGAAVELRISDTGKGIEREFLPYVFERFRQADGGTTRRHGGLGLGLALARHLVEAHGGHVRVESEGAGKGATFVVELPVRAPHVEARRSAAPTSELGAAPRAGIDLAGVSILVVDDEDDARDLVSAVLRLYGADVTTAGGADEALAILATTRPSVLISDIGMPGMDGYGLVRALRSRVDGPSADVPAVALTAYARQEDRRLALAAGFQTHVAKPVEPAELVRIVGALMAPAGAPKPS